MKKRAEIFSLFFALLFLAGCNAIDSAMQSFQDGSELGGKWINSEIEGAITADTEVSLKDDFFTAANKEWILAQDLSGNDDEMTSPFNLRDELIKNQKLALISDPEAFASVDGSQIGLDDAEIKHSAELLERFTRAAGNMEARNKAGVEPLRPYLEAIREIETIDELTEYMLDYDGMNIAGTPFVEIYVSTIRSDPEMNHVIVQPMVPAGLSLKDRDQYLHIDEEGIRQKNIYTEIAALVLGKLGYTQTEIRTVLKKYFRLEGRLAEAMNDEYDYQSNLYEEKLGGMSDIQEISDALGTYPFRRILSAYGYDKAKDIFLLDADYLKGLASLYNEIYLEEFKAFYIVRTIYTAADLLDLQTKDEVYDILQRRDENSETEERTNEEILLYDYVEEYLRAPMEMVYVARYCTDEQKRSILEMTEEIKSAFGVVLRSADWVGEEGKAQMAEKLANMEPLALYPDKFISYQGLNFTDADDLIRMVGKIMIFSKRIEADQVDRPLDRKRWNLQIFPTSEVNAYNSISDNRMYILAGVVADDFAFDPEAPEEMNLARLGFIIGHEVTHGFDSIGCDYDKYGRKYSYLGEDSQPLLSAEELLEFQKRSINLEMWYTALSPMPGMTTYPVSVASEAIADMGGMKTMLRLAEQKEGFDYDLFFRSYAEQWRNLKTVKLEEAYAANDIHPLNYLRVNVVLEQFDRFNETYGVRTGDGMYMPAEKRIMVW